MRGLIISLTALALLSGAVAPAANVDQDIVSHITADSVNTISQPVALARLLKKTQDAVVVPAEPAEAVTAPEADADSESPAAVQRDRVAGYRVQVFSDNRPAAKSEARQKGRQIAGRFPEYRTYVRYTTPYWRLRVGDFRTRREAEDAAEELRRAFPSYSKEIRVVQDRITVTQ